MGWAQVVPVYQPDVRELCTRRYAGHPHGCPNHGKRPSCPPAAPRIHERLDLARPVFIVWNRFDLGAHVERMRARHPDWSRRQLVCCLYWQQGARKKLQAEIVAFLVDNPGTRCRVIVSCPEACGVNVTETMKAVGIELEWPPKRYAYQVALVGCPARRGS